MHATVPVMAALLLCGMGPLPSDRVAREDRPRMKLVVREADRRVDMLVEGRPFTAYVWPRTLKKPVLHPIHTADGRVVTRGFPPGPGERADHPHHVGLWLNYGDVDGHDFWNNSEGIPPERAEKMGTVVHTAISRAEGGRGEARLEVKADWIAGTGRKVLAETTLFRFQEARGLRAIDRITRLRATGGAVALPDNKEGMLGLRVRRELEDPNEKSGEFNDASGRVTKMESMDTTGVTGVYTSSEGRTGKAVWGTRGRWTMLAGVVEGRPLTVAILDHPDNPGFPTYWHARGYGLFAANPLGQAALSEGRERLGFSVPAGGSCVFRHRVLLFDSAPSAAQMEDHYRAWTSGDGRLT
jgi:hypothetical protein